MRFSSPNPTFSACGGWVETFIPFGLRGRDSTITWLRQYQYNLHSPLQPGVVKALLLVLRSSAALALAAVAPLGVAQFIRMRTARSPRRGSQPVCIQTACRLQPHSVCVHSKRLRTAAVKKRRRQPHLSRISRKALRAGAFSPGSVELSTRHARLSSVPTLLLFAQIPEQGRVLQSTGKGAYCGM